MAWTCERCGQVYPTRGHGSCDWPSAPGAGGFACGGKLIPTPPPEAAAPEMCDDGCGRRADEPCRNLHPSLLAEAAAPGGEEPRHCGFCQHAPCVCPPSDSDVPSDIADELFRAASANGRIRYEWLLNVYRRGRDAALRPSPPAPAEPPASLRWFAEKPSETPGHITVIGFATRAEADACVRAWGEGYVWERPAPAEPPASADWRDFKADPPKPGPENRVLFRGISRGHSFAGYAYVDGWVSREGEPYHNYSYRLTITHWRPLP